MWFDRLRAGPYPAVLAVHGARMPDAEKITADPAAARTVGKVVRSRQKFREVYNAQREYENIK